jgi:hypothetical protein
VLLAGPSVARAATDGPDGGVGVAGDDVLEPVGLGVRVVVDEGDDVGVGLGDPDGARRRERARPGVVADVAHTREVGDDVGREAVRRRVDDDDLLGCERLATEVLQAGSHVVRAVEGRDDDVDRRGRGVWHGRSIASDRRARG